MNQITTDWRVGRSQEDQVKSQLATREIFTGTIDTLKQRLVNRAATITRQFGKNMVPRDIIYNALEDAIYEIEKLQSKSHRKNIF